MHRRCRHRPRSLIALGTMSTECRAWRGSGFRLSPDSPRWLGLICLLPNGGARLNRGGLRGPGEHVLWMRHAVHHSAVETTLKAPYEVLGNVSSSIMTLFRKMVLCTG